MSHPFLSLAPRQRSTIFWVSFVASLVIMAVMGLIGGPLTTPQAPYGIVSFELAGTTSQVEAILDSWDEMAKQAAAFSLGFDYLFMLTYSTATGLACLWAATTVRSMSWPLGGLGVPLAWGMWLAAALDAIENLGLTLILLAGAAATAWPRIVQICALLKFTLLFASLVYVFFGVAVGIVGRLRR